MKPANILVVDNSEVQDRAYNQPLVQIVSQLADCTVVDYADSSLTADTIKLYDGVILSGVPLHYSFESINERLSHQLWTLTTSTPLLGICLGHEVLGKLFGASILQDKEAENGTCSVAQSHDDAIFKDMPSNFDVTMLHRASVTLPDDFLLLASSANCVNVISRHKEKAIYGFQFHPELTTIGETLLANFINIAKMQRQPLLL